MQCYTIVSKAAKGIRFREADANSNLSGLFFGLFDAVGKSGLYVLIKRIVGEGDDELKSLIGIGLSVF